MTTPLAWALNRARTHTLTLVADVPPTGVAQPTAGERHPVWLLGHLLLADTYLLSLLGAEPLTDDFTRLLSLYGPGSAAREGRYDSLPHLIDRLSHTNTVRLARVSAMTDEALAAPLPDAYLATAQPTIGHHLQSLVFHEGYHAGQLSYWRAAHGFAPVRWTMGPA